MALEDRAGLARESYAALDAETAKQSSLADVIRWGLTRSPQAIVADVVVQDEFTHDVLVPLGDTLWLVYGTTWLGAVMAVAIWNHRPSAEELLQARLARGWTPTATELRDGPVIMGYAACLPPARARAGSGTQAG